MHTKTVLASLIAIACATPALAAKDNFDRAALGAKWVTTAGALYITDNALAGDPGSLGYFKRSAADSAAQVMMVLPDASLQYGAIALGNIGNGVNAFVKLQAQTGDSSFSHVGFYVGNNGGGTFSTLDVPAPSPAKVSVSLSGSVVTLTIKSAAGTQTYQHDYGTSFGTGAGLGTYGAIRLDSFKSIPATDIEVVAPVVVRGSNAVDLAR